jgi:hypothetical protein
VGQLSEERKRQIRAEEEAKFRAQQEAEQQYREQVREELAAQQQAELERQFREEVRAALTTAPTASAAAPPVATPPSPAPRPAPRASRLRRLLAGVFVLGGLGCMVLALGRGFTLPFTGPPAEITLKADTSGTPVVVGRISATAATSPTLKTLRRHPSRAVGSPQTHHTAKSPAPAANRVTLPGSAISLEVPAGWFTNNGDLKNVLEVRWRNPHSGPGSDSDVAYVMLRREDLYPGETVEAFAERQTQAARSSAAPDQGLTVEQQAVILNFQGTRAVVVVLSWGGYWPSREEDYYWILSGQGYVLTCSTSTSTYAEHAADIDRIVRSLRLSRAGGE